MERKVLLFNVLIDSLFEQQTISKKYYQRIEQLLSESSFSFGIKPLSHYSDDIMNGLVSLGIENVEHFYFERHDLQDSVKKEKLKELFKNNSDVSEENLLFLMINGIKTLHYKEKKYEELLKTFFFEPSYAFGFKPIVELIDFIVQELGKIYEIDGANDWFEWFVYDCEFGIEKKDIILNDKTIPIENVENFIDFLIKN